MLSAEYSEYRNPHIREWSTNDKHISNAIKLINGRPSVKGFKAKSKTTKYFPVFVILAILQ